MAAIYDYPTLVHSLHHSFCPVDIFEVVPKCCFLSQISARASLIWIIEKPFESVMPGDHGTNAAVIKAYHNCITATMRIIKKKTL